MLIPYNTISADTYDALIFTPLQQALGAETWQRINRQLRDYEYYGGKQHINPQTGQLVEASEMPRPPGVDYDPTRFNTNYFKSFIDRKARWIMSGKHSVNAEDDGLEKILRQLWRENKMRTELVKAARDYLIARRVACRISYDAETGKLRWNWRPDSEVIPVYADDDMQHLRAIHFVDSRKQDGRTLITKESFTLEYGACLYEKAIYDEGLNVVEIITPKDTLGLDFIPVVLVTVPGLSGEEMDTSEIEAIQAITDRINAMNEDASDALKFEMFDITAFINVPEGTADKVELAPGAAIEVTASTMAGEAKPDVKRIGGTFTWSTAFEAQYMRLKSALHDITSLPNISPQDLNFGGMNSDAIYILFQSIIQETEEHWLEWGQALAELHEKSIRYLQARTGRPGFGYDVASVKSITDYESEIGFVLPLPDNRKALVELLIEETSAGFESAAGAMVRLGVEDAEAKIAEIQAEAAARRQSENPYRERMINENVD